MNNSSTTKPKLTEAATTTPLSRTIADRIIATTGGKGRSRASSQSVFWEN